MSEPEIIINKLRLTPSQAMVVVVAINHLRASLNDGHPLGDDEHGKTMAELYRKILIDIAELF